MAIQSHEQFGARKAIEGEIAVEITVQADEPRIDEVRVQLRNEATNDIENLRADFRGRWLQRALPFSRRVLRWARQFSRSSKILRSATTTLLKPEISPEIL